MNTERRRYIRPESLNLLDYLVVDEAGRPGDYSMARTLNVSKGGILMETHIPLPKGEFAAYLVLQDRAQPLRISRRGSLRVDGAQQFFQLRIA